MTHQNTAIQHMASPSVAAQKVFAITELLECILLPLSMLELIPCRRVNSLFRGTIDNSVQLQTTMFLRTESETRNLKSNPLPVLNPVLTHCSGSLYRECFFEYRGRCYMIDPPLHNDATNPLPVIEKEDDGIWHLQLVLRELDPGLLRERKRRAFARETLQKMYLSQPVCDLHVQIFDGGTHFTQRDYNERTALPLGSFAVEGGTVNQMLERVTELRWRREAGTRKAIMI